MRARSAGEQEIARIERFCEKFLDDGNGGPWTLTGRDYVRDEIWRPMLGFRLVEAMHSDPKDLCSPCKDAHWSIELEHRHVHPIGHDSGNCPGLRRVPIQATLVNLPRRNAKTHSILSFLAARCFLRKNQRWAFFASAEDQAEELLHLKLGRPLSRHPGNSRVTWDIRNMFSVVGSKLEVPSRNSWIEVLPASAASTMGRGNTGIAGDECRAIKAKVIGAILPTIYDAHGWECPTCAQQWSGEEAPPRCPKDAAPLERWFGRMVLASASGPLTGDPERDWFSNMVEARRSKPVAECHVFVGHHAINPSVSVQQVDASMSIVAGVPLLEDYVAVEAANESFGPGEVYVTPEHVIAVVEKRGELVDACESDRAAVWFLDTSDRVDLTTLAVLVDDAQAGESPFTRVSLQHLKVWDPQDRRQFAHGVLDESVIVDYLAQVHERFTRLRRRAIDTRGRTWAMTMLDLAKRESWARQVEHYAGKQVEDDAGFQALRDYILDRRIRIPRPQRDEGKQIFAGMDPHARLLRELVALKKVERRGGGLGVEDPNADKRGRNKNKKGLHRDVSAALAGAALLAIEERKKLAGSRDNARVHAVNRRGRSEVARRARSGIWTEKA